MTTTATSPRGGFGYRHPRMRLAGLLTAPMLWLVLIYLGSLAALFLTAFWTVDDFTGQVVRDCTFKNFTQVFTNPAYYGVMARTLGIAVLVTIFCMVLALPLAFSGTIASIGVVIPVNIGRAIADRQVAPAECCGALAGAPAAPAAGNHLRARPGA